jgi:hypothetical protein
MLSRARLHGLACLAALCVFTPAGADEPKTPAAPPTGKLTKLIVYPSAIKLTGPRDEQRLGVLGIYADGQSWDHSRDAVFTSGAGKVAEVAPGGLVRGVGDGQGAVTVTVGGQKAAVPVTVKNAAADVPVHFTEEVQPILTRLGCNQGACHGSQHGKGGFKLSLLGFDPTFDYAQIVQSAEGRRVVVSDPESSILLKKPTLTMEHGGGQRMKMHGREYERIKQWLADGAPEPSARDPHVVGLEVWPAERLMVPGEQQQILVTATWSDGRREDVTATTQFNALNEAVAAVTPDGLVTARGKGETHVMVRFMGQATVVQITLPYARIAEYPKLPAYNFIDEKLIAKWQALGLTPSPGCSDEEFFRRIHLDTIGTLPAPADVKKFLADPDPQKRKKAIDKVLDRPEFVDFWALKWGDLLRINRDFMQDRGMWSFHNWVRACVRDNTPIDAMVRDIVTAEGSTFTEGPANFYMVARTPPDWSEAVTQTFLGVRVGCAKCHHHPFEKWSQDDYYGMAAFFVRLGTKNSQEFGLFGREQVVYLKATGEQTHPRKGGFVKPHALDGADVDDPIDRRVKLAEWLTAKDNPFFARNIVNRFWGYYLGRGLVEPLDDLRATNPASNPALLDALAKDFVEHGYDLKHLLRTIMNSRAYQLSAAAVPGNAADASNVHFARFTVRRLTAEQFADAIDFATGTREKYAGLPLGTRAIQLPDTRIKSFLLDVFGRPSRQIVCECERTAQPNIAQAMHLLNGEFLDKKISTPAGRVEKLLKAKTPLTEIVEELYLVTLSRLPRPQEVERALYWIGRAANQREGVQDLLWVLMNSREFVFNY